MRRMTTTFYFAALLAFAAAYVIGAARSVPALPADVFSPSNARTEDVAFVLEADFFPAARCASCHADTHAGWTQSLHHNAGREPFYKESVDILLRTRGAEFTRHCEACHAP